MIPPDVEMNYVTSSNIEAVGYDPVRRSLYVKFHSGGQWKYLGVPEDVYRGLMCAASPGRYYHQHVKQRYEAERIG